MNNDWLQGYLAALKNLDLMVSDLHDEAYGLNTSATLAYQNVLDIIDEVKENYKKLVKELNEAQSKKTTL